LGPTSTHLSTGATVNLADVTQLRDMKMEHQTNNELFKTKTKVLKTSGLQGY